MRKKLFFIVLLFPYFLTAQDYKQTEISEKPDLNRLRIGVKIGFPNLAGGNIEYLTPLLNDKFAVTVDYSVLNPSVNFNSVTDDFLESEGTTDLGEYKVNVQFWGVGINYYILKPGKGLYAGIGYGSLQGSATLDNIESNEGNGKIGVGKIDESNASFNIKLGGKFGQSLYFRPEIGYAFTSFQDTIKMDVEFDDGTSEIQLIEVPDLLTQGFIATIGFGFSFL